MRKPDSRIAPIDVATIVLFLSSIGLAATAAWQKFINPFIATRPLTIENWASYAEGGHREGPETAPVTVTWFGDYECPACESFQARLARVRAEYPDEVAIVYRHWPLPYHPNAYPAARAAICAAAQGRFIPYHQALYEDRTWRLDRTQLEVLAERSGVPDLAVFSDCASRNDSVAIISNDIADAAALGASGTPTIMVNNLLLRKVPNEEELRALVARAGHERY